LGWMTVDEVRAEQDLKELPEGVGKVVLGLKKAEPQPAAEPEELASEDADSSGFWLLKRLRRKKK